MLHAQSLAGSYSGCVSIQAACTAAVPVLPIGNHLQLPRCNSFNTSIVYVLLSNKLFCMTSVNYLCKPHPELPLRRGTQLHAGQANVTLNLDANALSQVFTCQITSYNSSSIKALNPGIE